MEIKHYAQILWHWLWLIVLCTLIAGAAAFEVSRRMTPIYEASTTLLINQAPASSAAPDYSSVMTSERLAQTYAELLTKRPVMETVISDLNLADVNYETLQGKVRVNVVRDTQLIVLTVEDPDPQRAASIANSIIDVFEEQNRTLQSRRYAASKQSLEEELQKVQADIDDALARLDRLQEHEVAERDRLQSLLAEYRSTYATVLESLEAVRLAEAQATNNVDVVEQAMANTDPVRPRTLQNTLLAALVGMLLAVGVAFLVEYLDESIKSATEAEQIAGLPVLASIARIEGGEPSDKLVTVRDPRSPVAEAYRVLRANIEFASVDKPIRTLVITSSLKVEGKSTTAANLAVAIAQTGKRVILVDTDLRRPMLHTIFRQPNERGFTTALLRMPDEPFIEHMYRTEVENLLLLPSGPLPPNPAELLGSQRVADLVHGLAASADIVIFDSPPLLAVVDAALLARICDTTLLVLQAESTGAEALRRTVDQLHQSGANVAGMVINRMKSSRHGYAGNYYYYHYDQHDTASHRRTTSKPYGLRLPFAHSRNGTSDLSLIEPGTGKEREG